MSQAIDLTPDPNHWPVCGRCDKAFVLRRVIRLSTDENALVSTWVWMKDCRHKSPPLIADKNGVVEPTRLDE